MDRPRIEADGSGLRVPSDGGIAVRLSVVALITQKSALAGRQRKLPARIVKDQR